MKSLSQFSLSPLSVPISAEDVTEVHASRLLLLLKFCGTSRCIEGLTKLAKLDFFVRYPAFFRRAAASEGKAINQIGNDEIESAMVRHHYGPWDKRYYALLPYLESRELITVIKVDGTYQFTLTSLGSEIADSIAKKHDFHLQIKQMKEVKKVFGAWKGVRLKNLIYKIFGDEVANKKMGEAI